MRQRRGGPFGRVVVVEIDSRVLRGNALGDPHVRSLPVYLPAACEVSSARRFPALYHLAGYTGSGLGSCNWSAFSENLAERLDRLIAEGTMAPAIMVMPDAFTRLGGNQYVNSAAVGRWEDHLIDEIVPFVDRTFPTIPRRDARAVLGKSSGGYGALVHAMRHPDVWGAAASHSGDMGFEWVYRGDFPMLCDVLARHDRDPRMFVEACWRRPKHSRDEGMALMLLGMCASYDPDATSPWGVRIPVDLYTCEMDEVAWARWLLHDPARMVARHADSLRGLRLLYLDCGTRDQFHLHYGARMFVRRLVEHQVPHVYEEFDDDHSNVSYRMDGSLPRLRAALADT
jgi:S-formylglutathione hydrolase FrmB